MNRFIASALIITLLPLTACQQPGQNLQSNVYSGAQVNQRQEVQVVRIMAVLPARVEVSNQQNKQTAQVAGAVLGLVGGVLLGGGLAHNGYGAALGGLAGGAAGGAAGSLVPDSALVDGVSITYSEHGRTFHSAQVGRLCEFAAGQDAIVVSTYGNETRIQPNATCPVASR